MSDASYAALLAELEAADETDLRQRIERHLTRFDSTFDLWLSHQVHADLPTDPARAARRQRLREMIAHLAEAGDYRNAQFDESHPANPKEVALALARRVERGELD